MKMKVRRTLLSISCRLLHVVMQYADHVHVLKIVLFVDDCAFLSLFLSPEYNARI